MGGNVGGGLGMGRSVLEGGAWEGVLQGGGGVHDCLPCGMLKMCN